VSWLIEPSERDQFRSRPSVTEHVSDTLGIDLSAQPKGTSACRISWDAVGARVDALVVEADDDVLTRLRSRVAVTAMDAPFGWPAAFVSALADWGIGSPWPVVDSEHLRHRLTDRSVRDGWKISPLSVSSDRIGACAWRCARLLTRWGVTDRIGGEGVAEVYPAAALKSWELPTAGYKHRDLSVALVARGRLVGELRDRCPWLHLEGSQWEAVTQNHDALDSLICALVGRAVELGMTAPIPDDARTLVEQEGWIHVPSDRVEALCRVDGRHLRP
jgi:hypothetical protein